MDFIDTHRVVDDLDEPTIGTSCQNLVGFQPQRQLLYFEDLVNLRYQLHSKLFLPYIIYRFDDYPAEAPRLQLSERRVLLHSDPLGFG